MTTPKSTSNPTCSVNEYKQGKTCKKIVKLGEGNTECAIVDSDKIFTNSENSSKKIYCRKTTEICGEASYIFIDLNVEPSQIYKYEIFAKNDNVFKDGTSVDDQFSIYSNELFVTTTTLTPFYNISKNNLFYKKCFGEGTYNFPSIEGTDNSSNYNFHNNDQDYSPVYSLEDVLTKIMDENGTLAPNVEGCKYNDITSKYRAILTNQVSSNPTSDKIEHIQSFSGDIDINRPNKLTVKLSFTLNKNNKKFWEDPNINRFLVIKMFIHGKIQLFLFFIQELYLKNQIKILILQKNNIFMKTLMNQIIFRM